MGRARKPLSEQTGNLTVDIQNRRAAEQDIVKSDTDYVIVPPTALINNYAKSEYVRITKELIKMGIIGNLDTNNLVGYCNAFTKYVEMSQKIENTGITLDTDKGTIENPYVNLQIKYAKEMREFARLCGMTIDSRLKFASVKLTEIEDNINDEFGEI